MPDQRPGSVSLSDAAHRLQIWAFPVIFAQRVRLRFTSPLAPHIHRPATSAGAPLNTMGHQRQLSDPTLTAGVAPNVDTLYSLAFLDLDAGEFELRLPDFGARYYSVQVGEADSSTTAVLGQRTSGPRLRPIRIRRAGDNQTTATSNEVIECQSRFVMVAVRILVDPSQPDDMADVVDLQDKIELLGPPSPPADITQDLRLLVNRDRDAETTEPTAFLDSLGHAIGALAIADVPLWVFEFRDLLQRAMAGPAVSGRREAIARGLTSGLTEIAAQVKRIGRSINGWAISHVGTEFGNDHLSRAAVAYSQIYINPAVEALYPICEVDSTHAQLNGAFAYTLTFPAADRPPAAYFWSLTVYHARGLLYDNEINRYAITDRTPFLATAPDGSLPIYIQTEAPSVDHTPNWLPCPSGEFRLMLRLYGPIEPSWGPPAVIRTVAD